MHDLTMSADATIEVDEPGRDAAITSRTLAGFVNGYTPLGLDLSAATGQSVDIINNLTSGELQKFVPGVPPGPQQRRFSLDALPETGDGNLALPALEAVPGAGSIEFVNDAGVVATGGSTTGLRLLAGAYVKSSDTIDSSVVIDDVLCREAAAGFGQQISMRRQRPALHAF